MDECTGHVVRLQETIPLCRCMDTYGLHDLRFNGFFFTWSNKRSGEARVFSKIDRVLGNQAWEDDFPTVEVSFLTEGSFDHTPMLIQFLKHPTGKKTFKFFNHWAEQEGFIDSVSKVCGNTVLGCRSYQISKKLKRLKPVVKDNVQENHLQALELQAENDLRNVQNELHMHPYDPMLSSQERAAAERLKKAKNDLSIYISQLAKLSWLKFGDENSHYFHQCIRQRQIVNRILLLDDNEAPVTDLTKIQESLVNFYHQLLCDNLKCRRRIDMNIIREGPLLENAHHFLAGGNQECIMEYP